MMLDIMEILAWLFLLIAGWYGIFRFFKAIDKAEEERKAEYEQEWRYGW